MKKALVVDKVDTMDLHGTELAKSQINGMGMNARE